MTILNRRVFVSGSASLAAIGLPGRGNAQTPTCSERLALLSPEIDPEFGVAAEGGPVGTGPSRHEEIAEALRLHFNAPRGKDPLEIAQYYEKINKKNADDELYNREWKSRANPLITGLFGFTGTAPAEGDQTYWCAAFVSFCLYLGNRQSKFTALSGGYRNFGRDVSADPRPGDVAVFALQGPQGKKGFGHVAFYLSSAEKSGVPGIRCLGGNQIGMTGSTGAVTESWFSREDKGMYLYGIRRG